VSVPVVVNGDIDGLAAARTALDQSGADGVMIGRASVGRPWLPGAVARALADGRASIAAPGLADQAALVHRQYARMIDHYGAALGVRVARKHLAAFIDQAPLDFPDEARVAFRKRLCRADDPGTALRFLDGLIDGRTAGIAA